MATSFTNALDHIVTLAQTILENVVITRRDEDEFRAVLKLVGQYQNHHIHLREVLRPDGSRKHAYYIIRAGQVLAEFDNSPDTEALSLKYGDQYTQHLQEAIPHFHSQHKQQVELTDEITVDTFLEWIKQNL